MKHVRTFLPIVLLTYLFISTGCAPSYHSFKDIPTTHLSEGETEFIKYSCSYKPFNREGGVAKKAAKEKIAAFYIEITNTSDQDIQVSPKSFSLQTASDRILPIEPEFVAKQLRSRSAMYMFWSLFWVTFQNEDTFIPIPVGVAIGLGQKGKANRYNNEMKEDMEQLEYKYLTIEPGSSQTGHVYFGPLENSEQTLQFEYLVNGEKYSVELTLERSMIATIMNDWKKAIRGR